MILFTFQFFDVIMKSGPKIPSNPHPSPCTCPVKWPKIRPVIERHSISKLCLANLRTDFSTILRTEHSESVQKKTICSYSLPLIMILVLPLNLLPALVPYLVHECETKMKMRKTGRQTDRIRKRQSERVRKSQKESERVRKSKKESMPRLDLTNVLIKGGDISL